MNACRMTRAAFAAVALITVAACSSQPLRTGSMSTQDAVEAQLKAAKELAIPVEKTLPKSGIVLRLIPAGTFTMGSAKSEQDSAIEFVPEDSRAGVRGWVARETQHKVTLTKAFYLVVILKKRLSTNASLYTIRYNTRNI